MKFSFSRKVAEVVAYEVFDIFRRDEKNKVFIKLFSAANKLIFNSWIKEDYVRKK